MIKPTGVRGRRNSLWEGVPTYLRELNEQLEEDLDISCRFILSRYLPPDGRRP
ncbi:hypothetical protein ACNKHK_25780 [Shigella flexneri]